MHYLINGSQVEVAPQPKPTSGKPGFFSESGPEGQPSWPGADWFNASTLEFMNALSDAGIEFDPTDYTHLSRAMSALALSATNTTIVATTSDFDSLKGKATVGRKIVWLGYYAVGDGGGNTGVIKQGDHTEDGGSIFSISDDMYIEADLSDKPISTLLFGDKADGSDQINAFANCIAFCKLKGIGVINLYKSTAIGAFNFPTGITFRGRGYKAYGEFDNGESTDLVMLAAAGAYGITFPTLTSICGGFEDINLVGDWTNHGVDFPNTCREVTMRNVSIKNVMNGIRENDLFKATLDNVTITCRGVGYYSRGGGTTTDLSGVLVQGDKENNIRCQTPFKFDETGKSQPKNSSQIRVGAAQYCVDVFDLSGSCRLVISSFNAENWSNALYKVHDTYKMKLDVIMPTMIPDDGAVIWDFSGDIHPETEIWQRSIAAADKVDVSPTITFMRDGSGLNPRGAFYMEYHLYDRIISQCDPLSRQLIRVNDYNAHTGGSAMLLSGQVEYRVPFSNLSAIYSNYFMYDFSGQRLSLSGTGWTFGNGLTFRVTSSLVGGGAPIVAQLSIRTQSKQAFNKVDLAGSLNATVDWANSELVITASSPTQSFVISPS
ncbi:hypothetical protein [Vibrio campbellii]|uniref:hypothetical protein n=1 Tax=Vibrio campbellii TaxID=680 RepID=UPI001F24ED7A|nr:hypothetical protein [Vibrio campbellii]MCE7729218.1 hypothetical protein [Vibrio campbellii]